MLKYKSLSTAETDKCNLYYQEKFLLRLLCISNHFIYYVIWCAMVRCIQILIGEGLVKIIIIYSILRFWWLVSLKVKHFARFSHGLYLMFDVLLSIPLISSRFVTYISSNLITDILKKKNDEKIGKFHPLTSKVILFCIIYEIFCKLHIFMYFLFHKFEMNFG